MPCAAPTSAGTAVVVTGVSAAPGLSLPAAPPLQEELESYPVSAIVRCDTVRPPGQKRPLLLLVCQEPERAQPDVHFFQGRCVGVSEPGPGPEPGGAAGTRRIPGAGSEALPPMGRALYSWGVAWGKGGVGA